MLLTRDCFNFQKCKQKIEVRDDPVTLANRQVVIPRLEGPWICGKCRQDKALLSKARAIMHLKQSTGIHAKAKV